MVNFFGLSIERLWGADARRFDERNRLWDISDNSETGFANQEYYEDDSVVDAYDMVGYLRGEHSRRPSSFSNDPLSFQAISVAEQIGATKILDVGCGAGFFRYALEKYSEIELDRYFGIDISERQIARAKKRYGENFSVASADELDAVFISEFDFVHLYSVLNFMHPTRQLKFLKSLLNSSATTIIRFSATERHVQYCPQVSYKNLGSTKRDGKVLLSQIGFCLLKDIERIVKSSGRY